jgi:hypothetical protein
LRKLFGGIVTACILTIGLSGVVAADTVKGQHGDYLFTDSSGTPGASCRHVNGGGGEWWLAKIVVRPPSVWWPDTNSSNTTQHGPVGWQAIVKYRTLGSTGSWTLLMRSSVQHATAYEDQLVPYGNSTKASFSKKTFFINGSLAKYHLKEFQVTVKAFWYSKSDGSVMGMASHTVQYYNYWLGSTNEGLTGAQWCREVVEV